MHKSSQVTLAKLQFSKENDLETLRLLGAINEDEYDEGLSRIFYRFADIYGFKA